MIDMFDFATLEPFYRRFGTWLIHKIYRPHYSGFEQIPSSGPAMIICNHVSYVDGPLIAAALSRPVRFVIYEPIYKLPIVHHVMQVNRAIPIYPTRSKVKKALKEIAEGLAAGDIICIFPEGELTPTGGLGRFRPGIEYIIQQSPVPVYPVALVGLWGSIFSRKHKGSWKRYLPGKLGRKVHAVCGEPLKPEDITVNRLQEEVLRLKYQAQM